MPATTSLYLNGNLMSQTDCQIDGNNTSNLKIGASSTCGDSFLGAIDEFRVWNVARSEEEVSAAFDCAVVDPLSPGLVGYCKFDEDLDDQAVRDSSPGGNDGTLGANGTAAFDDPTRVASIAPVLDCITIFADGFESGDVSIWTKSASS